MPINKYNSKVSTIRVDYPVSTPAVTLPTLLSGTDYLLNIEGHIGNNVAQFQTGIGELQPPTQPPPFIFDIQDRPILQTTTFYSNFADGFVFTTPEIACTFILANIIPGADDGYKEANFNIYNQHIIEYPTMNSPVTLNRFLTPTIFTSLPGSTTNSGGLSTTCLFLYWIPKIYTFFTDTIDIAFNGVTPQFRIEGEIEHTFILKVQPQC